MMPHAAPRFAAAAARGRPAFELQEVLWRRCARARARSSRGYLGSEREWPPTSQPPPGARPRCLSLDLPPPCAAAALPQLPDTHLKSPAVVLDESGVVDGSGSRIVGLREAEEAVEADEGHQAIAAEVR